MNASSANIEAINPLTPIQKALLLHSQATPERAIYFQQLTWTIRNNLDAELFHGAWIGYPLTLLVVPGRALRAQNRRRRTTATRWT